MLLWLMLLALPLQGIAAAGAVVCLPNHGMNSTAVQDEYRDADGPSAAGAMTAMAQTDEHHAMSVDGPSKLSKAKCGIGSTCFGAIALTSSPIRLATLPPGVAPASFVPASPIGFFTGGPDRPPRFASA